MSTSDSLNRSLDKQHAATARCGHVVRRAVAAGSLAVYAVLGTLVLSPSFVVAESYCAPATARAQAKTRFHVRPTILRVSLPRPERCGRVAESLSREASSVPGNMTATAGGKRLALALEMSREATGNLLLQQISPN